MDIHPLTEGVTTMKLDEVVYLAGQSLRFMPETDGEGRYVAGVTLYWDRERRPVVHCVMQDPDAGAEAFEAEMQQHVRDLGSPDAFSVFRGVPRPRDGKPILLAGAFHGDKGVFFGAEFGGKVLGIQEIFGKSSHPQAEDVITFVEATLGDLYNPTLQAVSN